MMCPAIAIHGGAGNLSPESLSAERQAAALEVLRSALSAGHGVLLKGGSALDAVVAAVLVMENDPQFNAGRGSVYNAEGRHEMDACIMDGRNRNAGAVAGIRQIRNPILAARAVMEHSGHVLLIGEGAESFAKGQGVPFANDEYFHDEHRLAQWKQVTGSSEMRLDHSDTVDDKFGTVGAVAVDIIGNLAAATSTGGMTNKMPGRVGDSPLVGAGTFADNLTCAISCTGHGEFFIREMVAHEVSCLMEYRGMSLSEACRTVIHDRLWPKGGLGGLIAVDAQGNLALEYNTAGMFRGSIAGEGQAVVGIW